MIDYRLALITLAAAGLIATGCGGDDDGDQSGEDTTTTIAVPGDLLPSPVDTSGRLFL